ncbi:MAG: hypothetical protein HY981_01935 [Candidatus Magasanikbacteria bacterium]|nr:hypothetical protein [Candidatus Magasanikbacteria bacterium]
MTLDHATESELNPQEQMVFANDVQDLKNAGNARGLGGLDGRVKFGLDPAGMMAVRDTAPLAEAVAISQGTNSEAVWPLIAQLHTEGPWKSADQLKDAKDPNVRTYLVLAAACRESGYPGYVPKEYLVDRGRVISELSSFAPEQFDARKNELIQGATIAKVVSDGKVPVAEGDVALPLAVQGYHGCVSRDGAMRFAQTTRIEDALLEQAGLVKGFAEVYNPEKDDFDRIPVSDPNSAQGRMVWVKSGEAVKAVGDMVPSAKRIAPGYVLTYTDEELAIQLVSKAIDAES